MLPENRPKSFWWFSGILQALATIFLLFFINLKNFIRIPYLENLSPSALQSRMAYLALFLCILTFAIFALVHVFTHQLAQYSRRIEELEKKLTERD